MYVVFYSTQLLKTHIHGGTHIHGDTHKHTRNKPRKNYHIDWAHTTVSMEITYSLGPSPSARHIPSPWRGNRPARLQEVQQRAFYTEVHTHHPTTTPTTISTNIATCRRRYTFHANQPHDFSANKLMDAYALPLRYLHACPRSALAQPPTSTPGQLCTIRPRAHTSRLELIISPLILTRLAVDRHRERLRLTPPCASTRNRASMVVFARRQRVPPRPLRRAVCCSRPSHGCRIAQRRSRVPPPHPDSLCVVAAMRSPRPATVPTRPPCLLCSSWTHHAPPPHAP